MIATLCSASGLVPVFLVAALAVQVQQELGFSQGGLGLATGLYFGLGGLSAMRGGRLADRIGWRKATLLAAAGSAIALIGIATTTRSYPILLAWMAAGAAGNGIAQPTSNLILATELPDGRRGLAFGIKQSSVPLATLLAGGSVPTVAALYGWRPAFLGAVALPAIASIMALTQRESEPGRMPGPRSGKARLPGLRPFIFAAALASIFVSGINTFAVVAAVDAGMSEAAGGGLFAAVSVIGLASRILFGLSLDLRPREPMRLVFSLLIVGVLGAMMMTIATPATYAIGLAIAIVGGWSWGGIFLYGIVRRYPTSPATATGAVQAGVSVGLAGGPLLMGLVADSVGHQASWLVAAGSTSMAAIWIRRTVAAEMTSP